MIHACKKAGIFVSLVVLTLSSCKTPQKTSSLSEDTLVEKMQRLEAYRGQYRMAEEVEVGYTNLAHIVHLFDFTDVSHERVSITSIFDSDQLNKTLEIMPALFFELPEEIRRRLLEGEDQSLVDAYYASQNEQKIRHRQPELIIRRPDVKFGAGILDGSKPGVNLPGLTDQHGNLLSSDRRVSLVDSQGNPLTFDEEGFIKHPNDKSETERKFADEVAAAKIAALKARISERWQEKLVGQEKLKSLPIHKHLPEVRAQVLLSYPEEVPMLLDLPPGLQAYFQKRNWYPEGSRVLEFKVIENLKITDPVEFAQELELISRITRVFRQDSKDPIAHFMDAGSFHLNYSKVSGKSLEDFAEVYNVLTMARLVKLGFIGNAFGHNYSFKSINLKGLISFHRGSGRLEVRSHNQFFIDEMLEIFDLTSMPKEDAFKLMGEEIEPLLQKIADSIIRYHFSTPPPEFDRTKPIEQMALIIEALMKHDVVDSSTLQKHSSYFLSRLPAEENYTPSEKVFLSYLFISKRESASLIKQIFSQKISGEYSILIDKILNRFPDIVEHLKDGLDASTLIDSGWIVKALKIDPKILERHAEVDRNINLPFINLLEISPYFITPKIRILLRKASASPSMEEPIKLGIAKLLGDQLSNEDEFIRNWKNQKNFREFILRDLDRSVLVNKRTLQPLVDSIILRDESFYRTSQYFRKLTTFAIRNSQAYSAMKQVLLHEIDDFNPLDPENIIFEGVSDGGPKYTTIQKALKEIQANIPEKSQAAALVLESIEKKMAERGLCSRL